MNQENKKILLPDGTDIETVEGVVGKLEDWERQLFLNLDIMGSACVRAAEKQTTIERTMKWLQLGAMSGDRHDMIVYAGLLHASNSSVEYKRDEAAWWVTRVESKRLRGNIFYSDGPRARRFLTRLLLSGSLSKNQDSVLYQSFFRSSLREVHLLPLISKYLVGEEKERTNHVSSSVSPPSMRTIGSLFDLSSSLIQDCSSLTSLTVFLETKSSLLLFLPLLLSQCSGSLSDVTLMGETGQTPNLSLSLFQQVDTSRLQRLRLVNCSYDSLSPLSLCDLSSLISLTVEAFPKSQRHPLNGLSSDITRSLQKLAFIYFFNDISPLSGCDLSSITSLSFENATSLSDLSPLRGSDLSSLRTITLTNTNVSDLSPLCECKGLILEYIHLYGSSIEDLSPLSLLDLSRLRQLINLTYTKVSDLSPLENISYSGVEVFIRGTPAVIKMEEKGLGPPQMVGNVKVLW